MSKYTTEIRYICETASGLKESAGGSKVSEIIEKSRKNIFDFEYPIFDEEYRPVLETKILKHFYTREIAFETVGLFKLKLDAKMNEIMPYYNQLYTIWNNDFDPFANTNYVKEGNKKGEGDNENHSAEHSSNSGNNNGTNWELYSDTPQGGLSGVNDMAYLTSAQKNTNDSKYTNSNDRTHNSNNTIHTTEEYLERIKGKIGGATYIELFNKYKASLLNIDTMIIEELNELFIMLW